MTQIHTTTKNQTKMLKKTVTTNFFVPAEHDLETQVADTLKNQIKIKMPKYP